MKLLLSVLGAAGLAHGAIDAGIMTAFESFVEKYEKSYTGDEYFKRLAIFAENMERVNKMNADHVLASGEAIFGINMFSDMSQEEFASSRLNAKIESEDIFMNRVEIELDGPVANDVDWRTRGVLTPVKDQGQCGSCWAFSATEAIESYAALSGKYDLKVLAPQQIVSCDNQDAGCGGGWPYNAMTYVKNAGGQVLEQDYPYTSGSTGQSGTCNYDKSKAQVQVSGYQSVAKGEANLEAALNNGPVSIAVDASSWSAYTGGVMTQCGTSVDHAVQAVGYTQDYWIVRNSWGEGWGEGGFIRIARGSNLCLISDYVTFPTI